MLKGKGTPYVLRWKKLDSEDAATAKWQSLRGTESVVRTQVYALLGELPTNGELQIVIRTA